MIQAITLDTLKVLADANMIGESFFKECGLPGKFKYVAFLHNWTLFLEKNIGAMWAFLKDGKPVGLLGGILAPDMNDGELLAVETFWYVMPEHRNSMESIKLLMVFELWARDVGAKRIMMAHLLSSMPEKLASYYEKRGYRPLEINYVKEL